MPSVDIHSLFKEEQSAGISVYTGGRTNINIAPIDEREMKAIKRAVQMAVRHIMQVAPSVAQLYIDQESSLYKWAQVFKGLLPEQKPITFPSKPGTIGVIPIISQIVKYTSTPSADLPAYTDYPANSWKLSVTAGTPVYLLGSDGNFYRASPQTNKHAMFVILQDGIIEVGTTPSLEQFRVTTPMTSEYGIVAMDVLKDQPIEQGRLIYQYPTIGQIPVYFDTGIKLVAMPDRTGVSDVRLVGIAFYEHDLLPSLTWIA